MSGWKDALNALVPETDPHVLLLAERVGQGKRQVEALERIEAELQLLRQAVERGVMHLTQEAPAQWPATLEGADGQEESGIGQTFTVIPQDAAFYSKAEEVRGRLTQQFGRPPTDEELFEATVAEYPRAES